ncbi:MAG: efflux RND transporter periplasmic adaptor subunit [Gammaproteobacteria bacterium]|nr:efflux RND transporter periplasmic adaptor subunit [Gammaproteobacteria bacterium]
MKAPARSKPVIVPVVVAGLGIALFYNLISTGPKLDSRPPAPIRPLVQSQVVEMQALQLTAGAFGTVEPRSETDLVSEVSGRIVSTAQGMVTGGFFDAGEVLFEVDPTDYKIALELASAAVAKAVSEVTFAQKDYDRQLDLKQRQSVSQALEDEALKRLQFAKASYREAAARLESAQRDLARTRVVAPYQGRVRSEKIDVGQYVLKSVAVAKLYATDYAEVRLPIQDQDLAYLNVTLSDQGIAKTARPKVSLRANFAGEVQRWEGEVVRTEGEIDVVTRMVNLVARIKSPYQTSVGGAPLAVGLFVEAEILGKRLPGVVKLPRTALRGDSAVFLIDAEQRLRRASVKVIRREGDWVLINEGLSDGDRVCLSAMEDGVEGMQVRIVETNAEVSLR